MDINITPEQINKIDSGALIQNVVPNLTRDEREFIISGITKNTAPYIKKLKSNINYIKLFFKNVKIFIYENNSTDIYYAHA